MPPRINLFDTYLPKYKFDTFRTNDDIIIVSSSLLSTNGDVFTVDKRLLSPVLVQTQQSINELNPEVSNTYPFRIVCPLDIDGSTMVQSPSLTTEPTASQSYYAPVYFERFNPIVLRNLDKEFLELTLPEEIVVTEEGTTETPTPTPTPPAASQPAPPVPSPTPTPSTSTPNTGSPPASSNSSNDAANRLVRVRIDEAYANAEKQLNAATFIPFPDAVGIPTTSGGWVWIPASNTQLIQSYRNGTYTGAESGGPATAGIILRLFVRVLYESQVPLSQRNLIIGPA